VPLPALTTKAVIDSAAIARVQRPTGSKKNLKVVAATVTPQSKKTASKLKASSLPF
jgi:hypothetical protein